MIFIGGLSDSQRERLIEAKKLQKYGALESWKELFAYQQTVATPEQFHEIAGWASRRNRGGRVVLPLMINAVQTKILADVGTDVQG